MPNFWEPARPPPAGTAPKALAAPAPNASGQFTSEIKNMYGEPSYNEAFAALVKNLR